MLTHSQIWAAIDALAAREGLKPSSLARLAGLDPTTFNRSKRQNREGQLRWPSTESIAKVLAATGASVDEFLLMIARVNGPVRRIPFRTLGNPKPGGQNPGGETKDWFDKNRLPVIAGWDEIAFPSIDDQNIFALEIRSDQFMPVFRDGDTIIVAPEAQTRRGDRVFVLDEACNATLAILGRRSVSQLHLTTVQGDELQPRLLTDIRMLARIIWASQ